MGTVFYVLPWYVEEIVSNLSKRNWLVHCFKVENESDLYNPSNYLHSTEFSNTKYTLSLDLNIYQFFLNIVKKGKPKEIYRDAAALLVFCQMADIQIDPTYAVYEKVNYNCLNLSEALLDLELFHNLNNSEMDDLAIYALGYSDNVNENTETEIDHNEIGENLTRYDKLKEWDSLYHMILSIIEINLNESIPRKKKLDLFFDWLVQKFRLSLVVIIYAIVFFGKYPISRMMKFNKNHNEHNRRKAIWNMTWDLYMMKQFFQKWINKNDEEEFFYASNDKPFCSLLRLAVEVQKQQNFEPVKSYLCPDAYQSAVELLELDRDNTKRVYNSDVWGADYRSSLITKYEKILLL